MERKDNETDKNVAQYYSAFNTEWARIIAFITPKWNLCKLDITQIELFHVDSWIISAYFVIVSHKSVSSPHDALLHQSM